jgi:tryptophan synthase beta subunit
MKTAPKMSRDQIIIVNCSGRGDKDVATASTAFGFTNTPES